MPQCLQQLPTAPIGQGFNVYARSKAVFTPSFAAFSIISTLAWSILFDSPVAILKPFSF